MKPGRHVPGTPWRTGLVGDTATSPTELPVVHRIARWFEQRGSLCLYCRQMPRLDGGFCSETCEEKATERQAFGQIVDQRTLSRDRSVMPPSETAVTVTATPPAPMPGTSPEALGEAHTS